MPIDAFDGRHNDEDPGGSAALEAGSGMMLVVVPGDEKCHVLAGDAWAVDADGVGGQATHVVETL